MSADMTPERWRQVTAVFHAALTCDAPHRRRYLDEACANDATLRSEVEAMLSAHAERAHLSADDRMGTATRTQQLESGTMIGPYRIDRLIGTGGMGEVYRARDPKLGRDVAIKVLPKALVSDVDRLARFERRDGRSCIANGADIWSLSLDGTRRLRPIVQRPGNQSSDDELRPAEISLVEGWFAKLQRGSAGE